MRSMLVTIAGPQDRMELSVPADTPVEKLLPGLLSLEVVGEIGDAQSWSLGLPGEQALPAQSTLLECGIKEGAILELRQGESAPPPPLSERSRYTTRPLPPEPQPRPSPAPRPAAEPWPPSSANEAGPDRAEDLRWRAGYPLQRTAAALPEKARAPERVGSAIAAAFSSERQRRKRALWRDDA
ncbi:MAG: EsaB/YukD family protein, partial [Solirubrobacterales bacterium]